MSIGEDKRQNEDESKIDQYVIGRNIAYCRKYRKMTQKELAEKCFVTQRAVSKWECGASLPDVSLLPTIAHIFEISLDELMSEGFSYDNRQEPLPAETVPPGQSAEGTAVHTKRNIVILVSVSAVLIVVAVCVLLGIFMSRYTGRLIRIEAEWGMPGSHSGDARLSVSENSSSGAGFLDFIAAGNDVVYTVTASERVSAEFTVCVGLRTNLGYESLGEIYSVSVNGDALNLVAPVPAGTGADWRAWTEISAGTINLNEGANTITFVGLEDPLCLDYFSLRPKTETAVLTFGDCTDIYNGDTVRIRSNDTAALSEVFGEGYEVESIYDMYEYVGTTLLSRGDGTDIYDDGWITLQSSAETLCKVSASRGEEKSAMLIPVAVDVVSYSFEAEWAEPGLGDSAYYRAGRNYSSGGGFLDFYKTDENESSVVFDVRTDRASEAALDICVGRINRDCAVSDVYDIRLNGEPLSFDATVPYGTGDAWYDWIRLNIGSVYLEEGNNRLEFAGGDLALCLDYIVLRPKTDAVITFAGCNTVYDGGRITVTQSDTAALRSVMGGEIVSVVDMNECYDGNIEDYASRTELFADGRIGFKSSGNKVWKVTAADGEGFSSAIVPVFAKYEEEYRLEAESGTLSGNAAVQTGFESSGNSFVDYFDSGTVSFTFGDGGYAGSVRLMICVGRVNGVRYSLSEVYALSLNGDPVVSEAQIPPGALSGTGNWHDWTEIFVGTVELLSGSNTLSVSGIFPESEVKPLCLDYITFVPVD